MKTITTKNSWGEERTYKVAKRVPANYVIWNIGENMGTDEYIPFAKRVSENPKDDEYYHICPTSVVAVKLSKEDVKILREAAHHGIDTINQARIEKGTSMLADRTLEILERIVE